MRTIIFISIVVSLVLFSTGCNKDKDKDDVNFDRTAMVANYADNIISKAYEEANTSAISLQSAAESFNSLPSSTLLVELQTAFIATYTHWQKIAHFDFGPADAISLKSNLNIYPTNPAKIEQNIQQKNYDLNQLQQKDAKGFPAIDYLLFHKDPSEIIEDFKDDSRKQYLIELIGTLRAKIEYVANEWSSNSSYRNSFKSMTGTDAGSALGLLVNAFTKHFESDFRDGKIGIPLGIRSAGIALPDNVEAYFSGVSLELAKANLNALESTYLGYAGVGLDDHLVGVNAADIDAAIKDQFETIKFHLNNLQLSIDQEIKNGNPELDDLYESMQKMVVLLKVEMASRLSVLISYQDNDGD